MGAFSGVLDKVEAIERRLTAINDRLEKRSERSEKRIDGIIIALSCLGLVDGCSDCGAIIRRDNAITELKHLLYDYLGVEEREEVKRLVKRTAAQGKR